MYKYLAPEIIIENHPFENITNEGIFHHDFLAT